MSTIKSSAENLTLNADGSGNDVLIQSNGSTKAIVTAEGTLGIGTASPAYGLHIQSNGAQSGRSIRLAYDGTYYAEVAQLGAGGVSYNAAGGVSHIFQTSGTERMRVTADGLTFNGDTAAANALDDYETGTFVPKMGDGTTNMSVVKRASYVKVGKLVTVDIDVQTPSSYSGVNTNRIQGLPFSTGNDGNGGGAVGYCDNGAVQPRFHITGASAELYFIQGDSASAQTIVNLRLIFSVTYHIP